MVLRGLALLHAASSPQLVADVALLERKAAAQRHDSFNVYTVPVLVVLTFASLAAQQRGTTAQAYYAHLALSAATFLYTVVDTLYNLVVPHVQPSTQRLATILLHHVAAGVLVLHPLQYPEAHGYLTAYATIVEVNTLFHSLSKKFKAQKAFVHAFHATWIGLRLGWYPYLLAVVFPRVMQGYSDRVYWQVVGSQAVLVGLNVVWTAEVVYGLLRPKKRKAP